MCTGVVNGRVMVYKNYNAGTDLILTTSTTSSNYSVINHPSVCYDTIYTIMYIQ